MVNKKKVYRLIEKDGKFDVMEFDVKKVERHMNDFNMESASKTMNLWVQVSLSESMLEEDLLGNLLDMIVYCDSETGREAIKEQIDEYLYFKSID